MKNEKKTKKSLSETNSCSEERRHFQRRKSNHNKTNNGLERVIKRQAKELKIKNGQLKYDAKKQLQSQEQVHILTKAVEATVDGVFIIDALEPDYPIIYANRSFQKMTGYTKREILGRNYFLFYGVEAVVHIIDEMKHAINKGKSFHANMLNLKKDGTQCWNSLRIAPVCNSRGAVTHYIGIETDLTLMRERATKIEEQREELLHVTRVGKLAEFVSSLAHEISQPLTAILSYAQAAQRMPAGNDAKLKEILQYIIDDDRRAAEVIKRLRLL